MSRCGRRLELDEAILTAARLEGAERQEYLQQVAAERPQLAREVRRRVEQAEAVTDSFLETPAAQRLGDAPGRSEDVEPIPLEERYELGECLGEGGMGRVFLAHDRQLDRRVAVKLLHRTDRGVVALLLREARLQARTQHEHVLEIYDSGLLPEGPFIAMQYVGGGTLADLAPDLSLDQRVRLLAQAAEGLHAAHRLGLVHRDVKPSNVLVAETADGDLCAKVADFGLAGDVDATSHAGDLGGTPFYVAPERLLDESDAADRRSDVYSLGVTLYRVLTGTLPFDEQKTMEILRRAVQGEFVPPRERAPHLPAELESVILRCMARDPDERYPSAKAVADDLRRYLDGDVVEAYAAGLAYRLTRFALRNRALVALAGAAFMALLAASVAVAVFAVRADQARDEAEIRQGQAEELIGFMVGDLQGKLAEVGRLEILEDVGDRAMAYFEQVPEDALSAEEKSRRAQALRQIGQVRRSEGDLDGADEAFRRSLSLTQALADAAPDDSDRHIELCAALFWVGLVHYEQGQYDDALPFMERYRDIAEEWSERHPEDSDWRLELAQAISNVGSILERQGETAAALEAYRRRLEIVGRLVESDPQNTAWRLDLALTHSNVGFSLESVGQLAAAGDEFRSAVRIQEALVSTDPSNTQWLSRLADSRFFLAENSLRRGLLAESAAQFREQVELVEGLVNLDPRNRDWRRDLAVAQGGLARIDSRQGRVDEAIDLFRRADEALVELAGEEPTHREWRFQLARNRISLAEVLLACREIPAAADHAHSALELLERLDPRSPEQEGEALLAIGAAHLATGRVEEARASWSQALERVEPLARKPGGTAQLALYTRVLLRLGRQDEARALVAKLAQAGYRHPELDSAPLSLSRPFRADSRSPDRSRSSCRRPS